MPLFNLDLGSLWIHVGPTASYKTTFALQQAAEALQGGQDVYIVSSEVTTTRVLQHLGMISTRHVSGALVYVWNPVVSTLDGIVNQLRWRYDRNERGERFGVDPDLNMVRRFDEHPFTIIDTVTALHISGFEPLKRFALEHRLPILGLVQQQTRHWVTPRHADLVTRGWVEDGVPYIQCLKNRFGQSFGRRRMFNGDAPVIEPAKRAPAPRLGKTRYQHILEGSGLEDE